MGAKTKLTPKKKEKMIELAKKGRSTKEIAKILGVSRKTMYNWTQNNEDLLLSYNEAKAQADDMVEAALFQRAMGYNHPAVKVFFDKESLSTIEHNVIEHYPPDVQAMAFWLKNRRPKIWKDKTEHEHSGKIDSMSDEELEKRIRELVPVVADNES